MLRRLEKTAEEYVTTGQVLTGYPTLESLYKDLDSLSKKDWESMRSIISCMAPGPYSFKYAPITDHIPVIVKQSIIVGIIASIATYYARQNILDAVVMGGVSATLAWSFLSERACKQASDKDTLLQQRVNNLLQHDRFFQPPASHRLTAKDREAIADINSQLNAFNFKKP